MSGFQHDIAGGNGNLVVTSLQSPNFEHDVMGWQVAKDGSAEFNDLSIRGTFNGTDYVINSAGAFFYSGTPAAGNLTFSIAQANGTDSFGNTYYGPGAFTYDSTGLVAGMQDGQLLATWQGGSIPATNASGLRVDFPSTASTSPFTIIQGASAASTAFPTILIAGYSQDGTSAPAVYIERSDGVAMPLYLSGNIFYAPGGTPETWHSIGLASGLTGTLRCKRIAEGNFMVIDGELGFTMTGSPQVFTCGSLPSAAYYPNATTFPGGRQYPIVVTGTPSGITTTDPRLFVGTSGGIQILVPSGSNTSVSTSFTQIVPLD